MIRQAAYGTGPWHVREARLDLDVLAQSESIFALSNGHIGLRGNLEEGEPHRLPGTYLNSLYEVRPLRHAESGYGYPDSGQTISNVPNGKLIRLLVDDELFDVRHGTVHSHERALDLQSELVANEDLPEPGRDPRTSAALQAPLVSEEYVASSDDQSRVILGHRTQESGAGTTSGDAGGARRMARADRGNSGRTGPGA